MEREIDREREREREREKKKERETGGKLQATSTGKGFFQPSLSGTVSLSLRIIPEIQKKRSNWETHKTEK